ncbi:MAG: phosphoglucosamine mutase [Prochlorotrichaceae cyanobacterium]|jgi:phosphoglucosamine mutase
MSSSVVSPGIPPTPSLSLPKSALFGTDGIRGRVGDWLTPQLALQVGFWTGQVLQQACPSDHPALILGQDSRSSSPQLAQALTRGLRSAGVEVWPLGLCPTPAVAYLTHITEAIGGIMVSASHNPPEDNGIKIFDSQGVKLSKSLQGTIEAGLRAESVTAMVPALDRIGTEIRPELLVQYQSMLLDSLNVESLQGLRVVLDLAWGSATALSAGLFEALGATVFALHDRPDGQRINVNCGSTHLRQVQQAVVELNADLGFAFDGDADRVLAVDHQGRAVDGDYILYLWGEYLAAQNRLPEKTIVTTVMANLGFERAWQAQGGTLLRTSVGDQYVQAEMARSGAMLGGEQSGHILCRHYGLTGDGLLTALHLAELVYQRQQPLATLVDQSFQTYPQLLRNVRVEDRDKRCQWQDCVPLMETIAEAEAEMGDRGRILVRASGTEPVIRVMVEAINAQDVQHYTDRLVSAVEQHLGG